MLHTHKCVAHTCRCTLLFDLKQSLYALSSLSLTTCLLSYMVLLFNFQPLLSYPISVQHFLSTLIGSCCFHWSSFCTIDLCSFRRYSTSSGRLYACLLINQSCSCCVLPPQLLFSDILAVPFSHVCLINAHAYTYTHYMHIDVTSVPKMIDFAGISLIKFHKVRRTLLNFAKYLNKDCLPWRRLAEVVL